jgi:hypothetical protein
MRTFKFILIFILSLPMGLLANCPKQSAEEKECEMALDLKELNKARTLAEKILKENPNSPTVAYVLSVIYEEREGNFPVSLHWVEKSKETIESLCGTRLSEYNDAMIELYRNVLHQRFHILGELDSREEQLEAIDDFVKLFDKNYEAYKIWPLLKLERYEEAEALGKKGIKSDEAYVRQTSYNSLMAVESEKRTRKPSFDWGYKGHLDANENSCVIAMNLGLASRQCFWPDEEEKFNKIAISAKDQDCSSSPYIQTSTTYLDHGDFAKSIHSLSKWRPKDMSDYMRSKTRVKKGLAELYFALGLWEKGIKTIDDVVYHPDRSAGSDSASQEMLFLESAIIYWAMLDARLKELDEENSARSFWDAKKKELSEWRLRWEKWKQKRQIMRFGGYRELLIDLLRPYVSNVSPWQMNALVYLLGDGILKSAVAEVREREKEFPEQINAYLQAFEAEMAWQASDYQRAEELATQALTVISPAIKILRFRLNALIWGSQQALTKKGIISDGGSLDQRLDELLQKYPTILRILDLRIPADIKLLGESRMHQDIYDRLKKSPRFDLDAQVDRKVKVTIDADESKIYLCMLSTQGQQYACSQTWIDPQLEEKEIEQKRKQKRKHRNQNKRLDQQKSKADDQKNPKKTADFSAKVEIDPDPIFRAIRQFHVKAFTPKVELSQKEMNTLDGNIMQLSAEDALDIFNQDEINNEEEEDDE